jgi:hypothetical protein
MKKIVTFVPVVAFLALASCATTKGSLFQQVVDSSPPSQGSSSVEVQPSDTNPVQIGLEVQTNPSDAQVYLNDTFIGNTPINYTDFQAGSYKITISKRGYYDNVRWLNLDPKAYTIIQTDLTPKTGYLLVLTNPVAAEVLIDGQQSQPGVHQIPVGRHVVRVRAFGFDDWTRSVDVHENQTIQLNAELVKATFRIDGLSLSRKVLNPLNPGLLGAVTISFQVNTYGSGEITIEDPAGRVVVHHSFPRFVQRNQSFVWRGRNDQGDSVPNGEYLVRVSGRETADAPLSTQNAQLSVDHGAFVGLRSMLSGTSGLLFAPTPEVLPKSSYSVGTLVLGHVESSGAIVPAQVALRAVPHPGIEIDGQGTVQLMSTSEVPYSVGIAGKFSFLSPSTQNGLSAAVAVKGTYLAGTTTDTLTNFTGLSVGVPVELRLGPVGFVLAPEVIAAPYVVSYPSTTPTFSPALWGYGRAGIFIDLGSVMTGASVALRSRPFNEGLGLAAVPVAGGWELHWLIPNTQLVLTGSVAGEYSPELGYYVMAGAGIGFIN